MTLPIVFNNTVFDIGHLAVNGGRDAPGTFSAITIAPEAYTLNGTINIPGDAVVFTNSRNTNTFTAYATNFDNPDRILFNIRPQGDDLAIIASNSPLTQGEIITFSESSLGDYNVLCFADGTEIDADGGRSAVEVLRIGDRVITASGSPRPITWIGHREIKAETGSIAFEQQPVRIRAGAFGSNLPTRDLCLSPGHPVLVGADLNNEGGVLVPAMCLINGVTITREPRASITYWHVELDSHDILLAEGLPVESYFEMGSRPWFAGANDPLIEPDLIWADGSKRCRPVAIDGPLVEAERLRLDAVLASSLSEQCLWETDSNWAVLEPV
ncbi:Hint domain-containing protein [Methylorubrum sp. Q1]|uniref:Hint domain-containing protein n=1 Tax=Methylorubrum sp. Q1 TaxID=2562453 RepID=UPI0010760A5B|nr:Hint domain-containing protein [Methylorubrum sp. Q1]TFZ56893.1 Hint domain-containing protein [Methylorubrum sp. Q1]